MGVFYNGNGILYEGGVVFVVVFGVSNGDIFSVIWRGGLFFGSKCCF